MLFVTNRATNRAILTYFLLHFDMSKSIKRHKKARQT